MVVALTGGAAGAVTELPAFALLAVCAFLFVSRPGAMVLLAVLAGLSIVSDHDLASSAGPTGREIGFALLFLLLPFLTVVGVIVDLVIGLARRPRTPA